MVTLELTISAMRKVERGYTILGFVIAVISDTSRVEVSGLARPT